MAKRLIERKAEIHPKNYQGQALPVIHGVSFCYRPQMVDYLTSKGADIRSRDGYGMTVLHKLNNYSLEGQLPFVIDDLIRRGIDINAVDDLGQTPLHIALKEDKYSLAACLIKAGADISLRCNRGILAIDYCLFYESTKTEDVRQLLESCPAILEHTYTWKNADREECSGTLAEYCASRSTHNKDILDML